ncbi:MAG: hypothetical protein WEA61_04405 [Anaerolineales bacterium]
MLSNQRSHAIPVSPAAYILLSGRGDYWPSLPPGKSDELGVAPFVNGQQPHYHTYHIDNFYVIDNFTTPTTERAHKPPPEGDFRLRSDNFS